MILNFTGCHNSANQLKLGCLNTALGFNVTKTPKSHLCTLFFMLALFAIDGVVVVGRVDAPERLSNIVCSAKPFVAMVSPLIFDKPLDVNTYQCAGLVHEPVISLVFLMIKIAVTFLAALLYWVVTLRTDLVECRRKSQAYIEDKTSVTDVLKNEMTGPITMGVFYLFMAVMLNAPSHKFRTDMFVKVWEDMGCLVLYVAIILAVQCAITCTLHLINIRALAKKGVSSI